MTLQKKILEMADRREAASNYDVKERKYHITLRDMSHDDELSYPAFLLLEYCWNDAISWAENPSHFIRKPPK